MIGHIHLTQTWHIQTVPLKCLGVILRLCRLVHADNLVHSNLTVDVQTIVDFQITTGYTAGCLERVRKILQCLQ